MVEMTLKINGQKIESCTVMTRKGPVEIPLVDRSINEFHGVLSMVRSIDWEAIKSQTIRKVVVGDVTPKKVVSSRRTHQRLKTIDVMKNLNIKKEIVEYIRSEIGDGVVTARKVIEVLKGCPHLTHLKKATYDNYGYTYYKYFITRNKLDDDGRFKKVTVDPIDQDAMKRRANDERIAMRDLVKR